MSGTPFCGSLLRHTPSLILRCQLRAMSSAPAPSITDEKYVMVTPGLACPSVRSATVGSKEYGDGAPSGGSTPACSLA
eukprot:scaffold24023_cov62-Phaeocystis_antarctica.AAC.5